MSESRLKKVLLLLDMAQKDQEKALETLGLFRSQLSQFETQLTELKSYLQEYVDKINNEGLALLPIQLQTTQAFIDKLHTAINAQAKRVEDQMKLVEKAQEAWIDKRARLKAFQNLAEKIQKDISVTLEKREQKMLDDLASQQFTHKNPSSIKFQIWRSLVPY